MKKTSKMKNTKKNEENLNEDDLKVKTTPKMKTTTIIYRVHLTRL